MHFHAMVGTMLQHILNGDGDSTYNSLRFVSMKQAVGDRQC
jgi:hypothetical protein